MEILLHLAGTGNAPEEAVFHRFGIEQCYVKQLSLAQDRMHVTRKKHHHTGFEIHMVMRGEQIYEIGQTVVCVRAGEFLLLSPLVKHRTVEEAAETSKYSLSFRLRENSPLASALTDLSPYLKGRIPIAVLENVERIRAERGTQALCGSAILCNRAFECIILFLRLTNPEGLLELHEEQTGEDVRLLLAKQYIADNLCQSLTVADIASYCCISTKQLTRLFERTEGVAVAAYVRRARCARMEELLANTARSLREISEEMGFQNEYYFNTFFKKHAGMSPGAFRKSVQKTQ
ncbi:MAG: helix-turn-helix transcriptional regulator [Clostridia bacterium]|nr:helix-turn-helix transcriptional regulator [Clostridia bacterium]